MHMVRKVAIIGLAAIAAGVLGSAATPVGALGATPVARVALPPAIDQPSFYEKQTVCQSVARPGSLALGQLLLDTYGPATIYMTRACTGNVSEHFDGRAVDWMRNVRVPAEREQAEAFLAWVLAPAADGTPMEMARRLGIMYLIWDNRMIRSYDPGRGWTNYRGCMAAGMAGVGNDTTCHRNHIHISLSWDGAAASTSWWTGIAQTQSYCPAARSSGARPAPGDPVLADPAAIPGLVMIEPTTVLDTATGAGLAGPCRLLAGRTLRLDVRSAIAGTNARVVALQLTARSNAPAHMAFWSSGRSRPPGQVELPIAADTSATILVPVASDATVSLATSMGAVTARARVIGYLNNDLAGAAGSSFDPPGRQSTGTPAAPPPPPPTPTPAPTRSASPSPGTETGGADSSTAGIGTGISGANQPSGVRASRPRSVSVQVGRGQVRISWVEPASAGSHPILGYQVAALRSPTQTVKVAGSCTADPASRSCLITGLRKGRPYWFSVRVTTAAGSTWAPKKRAVAR
jgi:hypothetical protein